MQSRRVVNAGIVSGWAYVSLLAVIALSGVMIGGLCHALLRQEGYYTRHEMSYNTLYDASLALERMARDARMAGYALPELPLEDFDATSMHLRADLDGDGKTDSPHEDIRYTYDAASQQLLRTDHTGTYPFLQQVHFCVFRYLDRHGVVAAEAADIHQLHITMTTGVATPEAPGILNPGNRMHTLTTQIELRNVTL